MQHLNIKKILMLMLWVGFGIYAYYYGYVSTKSFAAAYCGESASRVARLQVHYITRGGISYQLDERSITCRYASPFNCPKNEALEKYKGELLLVTEEKCQGVLGEVTVVRNLKTVDKQTVFYSPENLLEWSKRAKWYSDYWMLPMVIVLITAVQFWGIYMIILKGKK